MCATAHHLLLGSQTTWSDQSPAEASAVRDAAEAKHSMSESVSDMFHSSSSTDQLQLPVDVVGQLLLLLEDSDIQRCRLVSSAWQQAVDHQLRKLSPLHLPASSSAVFSSCETVRGSILRRVDRSSTQPSLDASSDTSALPGREFSWAAPIQNFSSICSSMRHAAALDLSAQQLPADCITQLAQHMPRLTSLKLDACKLPADQLCSLADFAAEKRTPGVDGAGLSQLSLAGIQLSMPSAPPAKEGMSRNERLHAELVARRAIADAVEARNVHGAAGTGRPMRDVTRVEVLLDAIAANALTHLDLCRTVQDPDLLAAAGQPPAPVPVPAVTVLNKCGHLSRLSSSLVSLKVLGNMFNADDWQHICSNLTQLTELHMTWDSEAARLELNAAAFQGISKLQRLQTLRVQFRDPRGLAYEPYTLESLAQNLTAVHISGSNSLSLLLSLTGCCNMRQLRLQDISGVAGTPELLVQLVRSMPLLQELHLSCIHAPMLDRVGLCHSGDYLLSQLDCCCPHLTKLVMPDVELNGTGIRLAATSVVTQPGLPSASAAAQPASSSAAAASSSSSQTGAGAAAELAVEGMPGSGALGRLRHLELNGSHLMSSALPHLSCLTGLQSLTLWHMQQSQLTHACRFDCFRFVSALTNLTSLDIPGASASRPAWMDHIPGAAAAAAAFGGGPVNALDQGDDDNADGGLVDIDLFQPFNADSDSDAEEDDFLDSGASDDDAESAGDDSSSSSDDGEDNGNSEEWEDAEEGDYPEAVPPVGQQQPQAAAAAAGQGVDMPGPGAGVVAQPGQPPMQVALPGAGQDEQQQQLMQQAEAAMQAFHAVAAQFQQQQQGAEPGAAAQELQEVHQQAQAAVGAAAAALQQNMQALHQEFVAGPAAAAALQAAATIMEPHLHFIGRLHGLVSLSLGCLHTRGPCLMHLNKLTCLQTLVLSGSILLDSAALQLLGHLRLPSVVNLSVTGCRVATCADVSRLARQALQGNSSSGRGRGSAARSLGRMREIDSMDHFVETVLCTAFPNCENLKLGVCDKLTIVGLATMLQRLPKLQRLWLMGTVVWGPNLEASPVPFNFVPTPATAVGGRGKLGRAGSSRQQQQQQGEQLLSGYVLPYDPKAAGGSPSPSQLAEEFAWFLEHGVVVPLETYACAGAAAAPASASRPRTTRAAAAAAAAGGGRGGAAEVPEGAVGLPFVAGSALKFVSVSQEHRFTRYMDRMVRVCSVDREI